MNASDCSQSENSYKQLILQLVKPCQNLNAILRNVNECCNMLHIAASCYCKSFFPKESCCMLLLLNFYRKVMGEWLPMTAPLIKQQQQPVQICTVCIQLNVCSECPVVKIQTCHMHQNAKQFPMFNSHLSHLTYLDLITSSTCSFIPNKRLCMFCSSVLLLTFASGSIYGACTPML